MGAGVQVILCEEDYIFGGRLNSENVDVDGQPGHTWVQQKIKEFGRAALYLRG